MTAMEKYILDNWDDYVKTCKAEDKRMFRYTEGKRNSWVQDAQARATFWGNKANLSRRQRVDRMVKMHQKGMGVVSIAKAMSSYPQSVRKSLMRRGYTGNE